MQCEKSCGSLKVIEKSNNRKGSPRVIWEMNDHPICYIYTLILHPNDFSPWLLPPSIGEEDSCFEGENDFSNAPLFGLVVFVVLMYLVTFA